MFLYKDKYLSLRSIARKLNRSHSTLSRELKRNKLANGSYMPCSANSYAWERLHRQRRQAPLKNKFIYTYVRDKLRIRWSPETIAGRLKYDYPGYSIHFETIYQYIYAEAHRDKALWEYLTQRPEKANEKAWPTGARAAFGTYTGSDWNRQTACGGKYAECCWSLGNRLYRRRSYGTGSDLNDG
jgi:IS30 family transposase